MGALLFDVRYVIRLLRRSPGFLAVAILTLAAGIAATTAIFSLVDAVLLRLPFADPDRLVRFTTYDVAHRIPGELSYLELKEWRGANRTFDDVAGVSSTNWSLILDGDEPIGIAHSAVTANFFDVLGARPLLGRTFAPDDDVLGAGRVAVLNYALWRDRFGSDPGIVGRLVRLSGSAFTVIGVMPSVFRYPAGADVWTPVAPALADIGRGEHQDLLDDRGFRVLHAVGRLKPAVSRIDAENDLSSLIHREPLRNDRTQVTPIVDDYFGRVRLALVAALAAAFLLLAIACANVTGLQLARIARRRQEWAIRRAIGGTPADLVRLTAVEATVVAIGATAIGCATTPSLITLIKLIDRTGFLAVYPVQIDTRILGLTICVSIATLLTGIVGPAFQAVRMSSTESIALRLRHRPTVARLRRWLVVAQVGIAVLLLVGTGLLVRSVVVLSRLDLGFEPDKLLVVSGAELRDVPRDRHDTAIDALIADIQRLPGVDQVAGVYRAPFQGPIGLDSRVVVEGDPLSPGTQFRHPPTNAEGITDDYFGTMGIRLRAGRGFTTADRAGHAGVVIVSESLAHLLWPGQNAIGRRMLSLFNLRPVRSESGQVQWETVVGIAADVRYREIEQSRFDVYLPAAQANAPIHDLVIRTRIDPRALVESIRRSTRRIVPSAAVKIRTMDSMVAEVTAVWWMTLAIIGAFTGFAVLLSMTGLYGILAWSVEERTHEIGIRVALGATSRDVGKMILTNAAGLVLGGVASGLAASFALGRLIRHLVFGVNPADPVTIITAVLLLFVVAFVAAYRPIRRAAYIDPIESLRVE